MQISLLCFDGRFLLFFGDPSSCSQWCIVYAFHCDLFKWLGSPPHHLLGPPLCAAAALRCSAKWCQGKYKQSANTCSGLSPLYFSLSCQEPSLCFLYQLHSYLDQHILNASLLDHSMKYKVSCFTYAFISVCWFSVLRIFQRSFFVTSIAQVSEKTLQCLLSLIL